MSPNALPGLPIQLETLFSARKASTASKMISEKERILNRTHGNAKRTALQKKLTILGLKSLVVAFGFVDDIFFVHSYFPFPRGFLMKYGNES